MSLSPLRPPALRPPRFLGLLCLCLLSACSQVAVTRLPATTGVFGGDVPGTSGIVLRLTEGPGFFYGWGQIARRDFGFAAFGPGRGAAVMVFEDGAARVETLAVSPAGLDLTLGEDRLELARRGDAPGQPDGAFTGVYRSREGIPLELSLGHWEHAVGGHGRLNEQAVVVAGIVEASGGEAVARVQLLFADSSRLRLALRRLPAGGLEVTGLGTGLDQSVELVRRARRPSP